MSATAKSKAFWTKERVEKLRGACNSKNITAQMIADAIGSTRNAVIGKASRLGISLPNNIILSVGKRPKRTHVEKPKPIPVPEPPPPLEMNPTLLLHAKSNQCRYMIDAHTVCGAKSAHGSSWCHAHFRIVYQAPQPRKVG